MGHLRGKTYKYSDIIYFIVIFSAGKCPLCLLVCKLLIVFPDFRLLLYDLHHSNQNEMRPLVNYTSHNRVSKSIYNIYMLILHQVFTAAFSFGVWFVMHRNLNFWDT